MVILCPHKPWPDGLALALQDSRLGQSPHEATILAQLGWAMHITKGHTLEFSVK